MQTSDEKDEKDARYTYMERNPNYNSQVLVGEWYHARSESLRQSSTAIVPCVLVDEKVGDEGCPKRLTTSHDEYSVEGNDEGDMLREYVGNRVTKYGNRMIQNANLQFMDAEKYSRNYTSFNTLVFDLWPKMQKRKLEEAAPDKSNVHHIPWQPDALDAYDNYKARRKRVITNNSARCPVVTTYRSDFTPFSPSVPGRPRMKDTIERLG